MDLERLAGEFLALHEPLNTIRANKSPMASINKAIWNQYNLDLSDERYASNYVRH